MSASYPPPHHVEIDQARLARLVEILRLATLIIADEDDVHVSFIPFLVERNDERYVLLGHIDAANPQAGLLDGRAVKAIFHGPQGYISPDDYETSQLPTWNYANVVAHGRATEVAPVEARRQLLLRMSRTFGSAAQRFRLEPDDQRMEAMLAGIRAFRIDVERFVGRFKLSQDKSSQDAASALRAMRQRSSRREETVYRWLEQEAGR